MLLPCYYSTPESISGHGMCCKTENNQWTGFVYPLTLIIRAAVLAPELSLLVLPLQFGRAQSDFILNSR